MKSTNAGTIVVGGGLAGLAAAVTMARRGLSVTLFEKAAALGGRAQTREQDGFHFNVGPHALYRGGAGVDVLRRLGIRPEGRIPLVSGAYAFSDGRLQMLPVGIASLLATGLLDLRDKAELAPFLARLGRIEAAPLAATSVDEWLAAARLRPRVRRVVEALVRVSTYGRDLAHMSAGAAVSQLQSAQRHGVMYLDGGWQSLVRALATAARDAGVKVVTGAPVATIHRDREVTGVSLAGGTRVPARNVVVAAGPREAAALVEGVSQTALALWAREARPVYMATLDLALARLPRPRARFALGIDRPLYFSVHSATARLAPEGGALLHAAMYLGSAPLSDAPGARRELEALVDRLQPGWREAVVHARFLPHLLVAHGLPSAAQGGFAGRPGPGVPEVPGLYVAGDWVGPRGLLADASLASGEQAAELVQAGRGAASTAA